MTNHLANCPAPICQEETKESLIWYPGECVCSKKPYKKFQKKQLAINKWIKNHPFKDIDRAYNVHDLEHLSI